MTAREIFLENRWWKLFSLAVAVLLWLYIHDMTSDQPRVRQLAGAREASATFTKAFPVRGLLVSGDPHSYVFDPAEIEVSVWGPPEAVERIKASDILVVADLSTLPHEHEGSDMRQHSIAIEVRVPAPMRATAEPPIVLVRQHSNPNPTPTEP